MEEIITQAIRVLDFDIEFLRKTIEMIDQERIDEARHRLVEWRNELEKTLNIVRK